MSPGSLHAGASGSERQLLFRLPTDPAGSAQTDLMTSSEEPSGTPSDLVPEPSQAPADGADGNGRLTERQRTEMRRRERDGKRQARRETREERKATRPRVRKLRLLLVFAGLAALAVVSWVFGILMAVASDLPELEAQAQFERAQNSIVLAEGPGGEKVELATLTGNNRRILVESEDIALVMKQAVVSIEDERFYEHRGIDYLGLARALREDVIARSAVQGGSTITQQFVKNVLEAQDDRTVLQKLKEGALAYQIERQWSKDKILTNYLNNIYFGEGAYGIEAAAKTFFGWNHPNCGETNPNTGRERPSCASQLRVEEAAMLAGMISSPAAYSPKANPEDALDRRDLVLGKLRELGYLEVSDEEFAELTELSGPPQSQIEPPEEDSKAPYFTNWLRQQVVDRYGAGTAFGGGLEIISTLDLELQEAAQEIVDSRLDGLGPTGAVVVMDNDDGAVRAMVAGSDFEETPFNLATNGRRQPGSSFKPFTLLAALEEGHGPDEVFASKPVELGFKNTVRNKNGKRKTVNEVFEVNNYDDNYLGSASLATATTYSDNAVYAQLGMEVGPSDVAKTARRLGIQSRISKNPAMLLGGLRRGVTPLEMAYAYTTLANGGERISGTMASRGIGKGPVALEKVLAEDQPLEDELGASGENEQISEQVVEKQSAAQAVEMLRTVVTSGTGKRAQVGDEFIWGKTGTTDNNVDAWFVGANEEVTVAVWVGYEEGNTEMLTEYGGSPVDGGTIPTEIFADVLEAYIEIMDSRRSGEGDDTGSEPAPAAAPVEPAPAEPVPAPAPVTPEPEPEEAPATPAAPAPGQNGGGGGQGGAPTAEEGAPDS